MAFVVEEEKRQCRGEVFREELAANRKNSHSFFRELHTRVILSSVLS